MSPSPTGGAATDAASLVENFRSRGVDAIAQGRFLWYASARGIYQCLPCHEAPDDLDGRLRALFRKPGVIAARFVTDEPVGSRASDPSMVYVVSGGVDLGGLSYNARRTTRLGLERCTVERVDPATLAEAGIPLSASTAQRQGATWTEADAADWRRFTMAASDHPAFEAWTARVDDRLAALAVGFQINDSFYISNACSDAELLRANPNNALVATILEDVLARDDVDTVCYGMASLDAGTRGLHQFKLSMGFEARPMYDNIVVRFAGAARAARPVVKAVAKRTTSHRIHQIDGALERVQSRRSIRRSIRGFVEPRTCPICQSPGGRRITHDGRRGLYRCEDCEVRFTWPQPTAEELSDYYENEYIPTQESMDLWFDHRRVGALDRTYAAVTRHEQGGRILDVGSAGGQLLQRFPPDRWTRTAVEPSKLGGAHPTDGIEFLWGLYPEAVPEGREFDVVTMLDVIMLMGNPLGALEACHQHLRADGLLAVEIPGNLFRLLLHVGPIPWLRRRGPTTLNLDMHQFLFDDRSLRRLLNRTGFEVVDVEPLPASRVDNRVVDRLMQAHSSVVRRVPGLRTGRPSLGPKFLYLARRR